MNKEALKKAMKASISEVLEKMFFIPLEFANEKSPTELWPSGHPEEIWVAALDFKGSFSGQVYFFIPKTFAQNLTASFLGENRKAVTAEQTVETVKEIINMIAGNTFGLYDEKAVFNLGIPRLGDLRKMKIPALDKQNHLLIVVDTPDQSMIFHLIPNA